MGLDAAHRQALEGLVAGCRWCALASTNTDGTPLASMVAVVPESEEGALLMHLSTLAAHTRNLLARPSVSLVLGEGHRGEHDPQTLLRLTVSGRAQPLDPGSEAFARLGAIYRRVLPGSVPRFDLGDFVLLRVLPERGRVVAGFGQAFGLGAEALRSLVRTAAAKV